MKLDEMIYKTTFWYEKWKIINCSSSLTRDFLSLKSMPDILVHNRRHILQLILNHPTIVRIIQLLVLNLLFWFRLSSRLLILLLLPIQQLKIQLLLQHLTIMNHRQRNIPHLITILSMLSNQTISLYRFPFFLFLPIWQNRLTPSLLVFFYDLDLPLLQISLDLPSLFDFSTLLLPLK